MALWAKIQTLNTDCQREILSLYNEEHPDFKFPIELRNLFAEIIENAVCGGTITLEAGLDPANPQHREPIINFFNSLAGLLEERLGNTQSGDQFFTRHKLTESLAKINEKRQSDPIGLYEYIRNRIQTELSLVSQQESACSGSMMQERDVIMETMQNLKAQVAINGNILKEIRANDEQFALNCTKKQELEAVLNNPEQLQNLIQQSPGYDQKLRENLMLLEGHLQNSVRNLQNLMQRFEQIITSNLDVLVTLESEIFNDKLTVWKHEQQRMANGIFKPHSIPLKKLQSWCDELADLIWKHYGQLQEAERILQTGVVQTGSPNNLSFVQYRTEEVKRLLQEILNRSLIVEEQPPQIIKMKTKFPKAVVVSLLVGKRLNVHMDRPMVSTSIISEDQANSLPVADEVQTIGEIQNGAAYMECKEDSDRLSVVFRSMQLKTIKRTDRRGNVSSERVMEEKSCLYFSCVATVGSLRFKVSTISLPVVVISHGSQEALAVATISWDNAFGEIGRVPFKVPNIAPWADVAQILNAKFVEVGGRGLTEDNLACLAQKAFRNRRPQPETITWAELCKENLPGRNFTFWAWFHAALKLIEKKETHLKEPWKDGLIMGFIDRESAEQLISRCEPGTCLLRFADSIAGAITIALLVKPGTVVSLNPYQLLDLQSQKLAMQIKDIQNIRYLYQQPRCIHKDDAFGKYYDKEPPSQSASGSNGKPYVPIMPTIPGGDDSNGSQTPVPSYDGSGCHRMSFPDLSPISAVEHLGSPNPFLAYPPPSPSAFQDMSSMQSVGIATSAAATPLSMEQSSFLLSPETSQGNLLYTTPSSPYGNNAPLDTPLPSISGPIFGYDTNNEFQDLLRVIREDTGEAMDMI